MGTPLARVGGAPLRRGRPGAGVRHRHAAADRVGLAARRARLQLHADGRPGATPPDARQERLLPDGLGRQRPADRAARPELLPRALRGPRALRAGPRPRDGRRRGPQAAAPPDLPRELHRALPRPHRRGREGLQGPVAAPRALGGLAARVLHDQRAQPAHGAVELPGPAPQGAGVPGRGADPVGRGLQDRGGAGRGRGPAAEGRLPPRALRGRGRRELRRRHHAPRAASGLRGGGRAPRRRALPLALREAGGDPRLPRAGAHLPERARGPREGHGHPDGLHVRRRDGRAVVARAGPRPAAGHRPRRAPSPRGVRGRALPEPRPREGERGVRAPGRPDRQGGAEGRGGAAARPGRVPFGRGPRPARLGAAAARAPGEVLREGRPSPRVHHHPAVVREDPRAQAGARGGGGAGRLAPGLHGPALPQLDGEPEPRLVHQPAAVLRRALPGVVPGARRTERPTSRPRSSRTKRRCRSTR